jgi:hypothetical protein
MVEGLATPTDGAMIFERGVSDAGVRYAELVRIDPGH